MRIARIKKILVLLLITAGHTCLLPYEVKGQPVEGAVTVVPGRSLLSGVMPENLSERWSVGCSWE